jgi:transposase
MTDYSSMTTQQIEEHLSLITRQETANILKEQSIKINELNLALAIGRARTFSKKSEVKEKIEINLFNYNEVENNATTSFDEELSELKEARKTTPRKKKATNHKEINFEQYVTETIIHTVDNCECGGQATTINSEDVTYKVEIETKVNVIKHVYKKSKCNLCGSIQEPIRDTPFNNSIATPSLVSYLANQKFINGVTLYRLEQFFKNIDFSLSRVDSSNYLMKGAAILSPFYDYLHDVLLSTSIPVIHADETTLKVINLNNKEDKREKSYMWLYATCIYDYPIYFFDFRTTRQGKWPREVLKGYKGYLVTDAYPGYDNIIDIIRQLCMIHGRRKFFEIFKSLSKDLRDNSISAKVIGLFDKIFYQERLFKENNLSPDEIKTKRNSAEYLILLTNLKTVLENINTSPSSALGQAVAYTLNNFKEMTTFLKDGHIPVENNLAERGIKSFVIGRKNFLFCNTEKGAKASAIYYTILQTAKANNIDTNKYLEFLFNNLYNYYDTKEKKDLSYLLPWNEEIQKRFKKVD